MSALQRKQPPPGVRRDSVMVEASRKRSAADEWRLVEFRPAGWLLALITVLAFWLAGPVVGKRALLALAWRFTPRRLRLVAGGVTALVLLVLVGSLLALLLALGQLA